MCMLAKLNNVQQCCREMIQSLKLGRHLTPPGELRLEQAAELDVTPRSVLQRHLRLGLHPTALSP